jgi:hypothetical protein
MRRPVATPTTGRFWLDPFNRRDSDLKSGLARSFVAIYSVRRERALRSTNSERL